MPCLDRSDRFLQVAYAAITAQSLRFLVERGVQKREVPGEQELLQLARRPGYPFALHALALHATRRDMRQEGGEAYLTGVRKRG